MLANDIQTEMLSQASVFTARLVINNWWVIKRLLVLKAIFFIAACSSSGFVPIESREQPPTRDITSHVVESGDTLYGIAWLYQKDYRDIAALNGINAPYSISIGQRIQLIPEPVVAEVYVDNSQRIRDLTSSKNADGAEAPRSAPTSTLASTRTATVRTQPIQTSSSRSVSNSPAVAVAVGSTASSSVSAPSSSPAPVSSQTSVSSPASASQSDVQASRQPVSPASKQPLEQNVPSNTGAASNASASPSTERTASASTAASSPTRTSAAALPDGVKSWAWPLSGNIVKSFGSTSLTLGITLNATNLAEVKAAADGLVVYAGSGIRGYGNFLVLKHSDTYLSAYAYNEKLLVSEGDQIHQGQQIAVSGEDQDGKPRLYFEIRKDGKPVDPLGYLPKR